MLGFRMPPPPFFLSVCQTFGLMIWHLPISWRSEFGSTSKEWGSWVSTQIWIWNACRCLGKMVHFSSILMWTQVANLQHKIWCKYILPKTDFEKGNQFCFYFRHGYAVVSSFWSQDSILMQAMNSTEFQSHLRFLISFLGFLECVTHLNYVAC